ncbi:MAG: hypothetical protein AB9842_05975 [Bacteroidales bacterium]
MKHRILLPILISIFISLPLYGLTQAGTWQCELYQAFISKDMQQWKKAMLSAELKLANTKDAEEIFDLAQAFYGYTGYLLGIKDKVTAAVYKKKLDQYIHKLETMHYKSSRVMALQASSRAFRMALEPMTVMTEGPKLVHHINKSLESDPNCPYALYEQGNAFFHRPKSFGGSNTKALGFYKKAVANYKTDTDKKFCDWYYINILNQLSTSYKKAGLEKESAAVKEKIHQLTGKAL